MEEEPTYWTRFWRRRLSRRRLLTGAALTGSGVAAAAVVGCGGDDSSSNGGGGGGDDVGSRGDDLGAEEIIDARRPVEPAPADMRGGTIRSQGFDPVVLDRHDPHQTQFGPMYANLSSVFSKLYMYRSHSEPTWENIVPDLAESAPEMIGDPPTEYVVKLRQGVKFHNTDAIRGRFPNLAGRELKADDVVFSYDRQRNTDSIQKGYYYRRSQYETIDSIVAEDDYTIRIKTKGPIAPFYHFLADTNAMIIPKEIVDNEPGPGGGPLDTVDTNRGPAPGQRMIGTGPFFWGDLKFGIEYKALRNPEWFGWGEPDLGRPYLDGYTVSGSSLNDTSLEALFRRKEVDTAGFIENPDWVFDIKREKPELEFFRSWISGWINSRFKVFCAPYDDVRVRKAIHLATERQQIVDVIGSGEWRMQGPVGNAIAYWALPYEELLTFPGYRQGSERTQDITEARQLYEAAGSPELPQVWFADIPSYIPNFIGTWKRFMNENLGIPADNLRTITQAYSRIAEVIAQDDCDTGAMTWGFDNGWIDLDDWVYPYFHSTGSKNSFRLNDPELDVLLDAQRKEFDYEARRELGYQIQRYLLGLEGDGLQKGAHARSDYATPRTASVSWPFFKNRVTFPWFGSSYWSANVWLDKNDPSYRGRPA
jgi:peptide/nickel transport system substrate-binding protein